MRLRIDLKIFIFLFIFYLTKQMELYGFIMFFAFLHELGHLFAGILFKLRPEKIEIMPFGFSISFKISTKEYNRKINNETSFFCEERYTCNSLFPVKYPGVGATGYTYPAFQRFGKI